MSRGRPPNSEIRQQIVEILNLLGKDYGYRIYKLYCRIFPKVSMRVVYYHLNKGVELGMFEMERQNVEGEYSWGKTAEKVFYSLGPNAVPVGSSEVEKFFEKNPGLRKVSNPWEKKQD